MLPGRTGLFRPPYAIGTGPVERMTPRQRSLLGEDVREASPDAIKKVPGKVTRALTALAKAMKADPVQAYSARGRVVAALRDLDTRLEGWVQHLDGEQAAHVRALVHRMVAGEALGLQRVPKLISSKRPGFIG